MTPRRLCSWTMCLAALQAAGFFFAVTVAEAATQIPLTVNMSEAVVVTGIPRVAVDVGGQTRYATYTSGSTTSALVFTLTPQSGDLDLDGIAVSSSIQLNGGTIKDTAGNDATLTFTPPNTSGVKVSVPSLSMDFVADADGRYTLNGTVYNDLTSFLAAAGGTFTRASTATYFDSAGVMQTAASGAPRFDYDPTTLQFKGILLEGSRTNALKYSEQFDNAIWGKSYISITPNAALAPDGTLTADQLDATNANSYIYQVYTGAANTSYTFSVWIKSVSGTTSLRVNQYYNAGNAALATLTLTADTTWRRYVVTANTGATSSPFWATIGGAGTFSTGESIYVWGAQLETAQTPTSYIPTTTVAVTRASDVLTMPTGGWYNATVGSFMVAGDDPYMGSPSWPGLASLDDGTASNAMHLYLDDAGADAKKAEIYVGGTGTLNLTGATYTAGATLKQAMGYELNNSIVSMDGTLSALDTVVAIPAVTTLRLAYARGGTSPLSGHIRTFKYYPLRATNTQIGLLSQ